nr:radical SAM protein [Nanoarchaeum sp.]
MFDPLELTRKMEEIVCKNLEKKYYRFRPAKFYGGISTSDCVGCNLRCIFCWSWKYNTNPEKYGNFYSPKDVAEKLVTIAKK